MHRTDASGHSSNLFTDGNPSLGVEATVIDDDWLNAVQEELINLLTQASVTPVKGTNTQVYTSMLAIIAARLAAGPTITSPAVSFAAGGSVTLPAWTALSYSNSWVTFSATPTAGWRKLADGNIQLRGAIKSGTTTDATVMFTLPAGARPQSGHKHLFRPTGSAQNNTICEVNSDGTVKVYAFAGTNTEVCIDGVIFPTT